jgi:hypothetical protein
MKHLCCSAVLVVASFSHASCTSQNLDSCKADADCDVGFFCNSGVCLCRTNDACGVGQYCNPFGSCQARPPCLGNQDCNADEICNSADLRTGGSCIPATSCGAGVHCPFNNYCSKPSTDAAGTCQPGCHSTGDCQLGDVCAGGACTSGGTASDCTLCPATPLPDASYCDYGELCSAQGTCQAVSHASAMCATCSHGGLFDPAVPCSSDNAICILDNEVSGAEYCAPSCLLDSDCPNGYAEGGCGKLTLVDPNNKCTATHTCSNGAVCMVSAESADAYCGCVSDSDCVVGFSATCEAGSMFMPCDYTKCCSNSGLPCSTVADCDVTCEQVPYGEGTAGVCLTKIGACGKDQGSTCETIKTTPADCRLQ